MKRSYTICLALASLVASLRAEVVPAPPFTDHAVLQRDKPIPVWGTARPGEKIAVTFSGHAANTVAAPDGRWRVELPALTASATPAELLIRGEDNTVTLADVLVGEVWLASGQSNMVFTVGQTTDAAIDIPASARFPLIRHFQVGKNVAETPTANGTGSWSVAGPATTGEFSAVAYHFALDLHQVLGVPVGILNSSRGGTRIEAWMDPDALASNPAFSAVTDDWARKLAAYPEAKARHDAAVAAAKASGARPPDAPWGPGHTATPSGLYNGMIHPVVPYALRGVIWYQGENNAHQADRYAPLFSALIPGWRARFGQGDIPFYLVQLPNYRFTGNDNLEWAFLREAQTRALALPATGQAVTLGLGDVADPHPANKREVARRLARIALARTYGLAIADRGPSFAAATREGAGFRVSFTEIAGGLRAPLATLAGFELAGADRVFKPAEARIAGTDVIVTSPAVSEPVAVRYAWRNAAVGGLFNAAGLPATPFRTDAW